jgi:hypothetical protein
LEPPIFSAEPKKKFWSIFGPLQAKKICWESNERAVLSPKTKIQDKVAAFYLRKKKLTPMWQSLSSKKTISSQASLSVAPNHFFETTDTIGRDQATPHLHRDYRRPKQFRSL